jgi:hypothetical protein
MARRLKLLVLFLLGAASASAAWVPASPAPPSWQKWQVSDPLSTVTVDHGVWDRFLRRYTVLGPDGIVRVAYGSVSAEDRQALDQYLQGLSTVAVTHLSRSEQLAYWLNMYNALTVKVVLDHYPVASIRDIAISPGLLSSGPWDRPLTTVDGLALSLNDIEHRILRPLWRDPRVHYGLNCASIGCPNLPVAAISAATADAVLDAGARAFVNHPRGASVTAAGLQVSSIYIWFKEDFGGTDPSVIAHLRQYADPDLLQALAAVDDISSHRYDWSLNGAPAAKPAAAPAR